MPAGYTRNRPKSRLISNGLNTLGLKVPHRGRGTSAPRRILRSHRDPVLALVQVLDQVACLFRRHSIAERRHIQPAFPNLFFDSRLLQSLADGAQIRPFAAADSVDAVAKRASLFLKQFRAAVLRAFRASRRASRNNQAERGQNQQ
jgi:hypothetical protein